jgi:hypothetical protein
VFRQPAKTPIAEHARMQKVLIDRSQFILEDDVQMLDDSCVAFHVYSGCGKQANYRRQRPQNHDRCRGEAGKSDQLTGSVKSRCRARQGRRFLNDLLGAFGAAATTAGNAEGIAKIVHRHRAVRYGVANLVFCYAIAETDVQVRFPGECLPNQT